jgi:hypothetical protein
MLFEEVTARHGAAYDAALRGARAGDLDAYSATLDLLARALQPGEAKP